MTLIFIILILGVLCLYILYICLYRRQFKGQDRLFIMDPEDEFRNYPMATYKLETIDDKLFDYIVSIYTPLLADKKSPFRLECDTRESWTYSDVDSDIIASYTFKKIDTIVGIDKLSVAKETAENPNKIKFFIASNGFILCGSHLLHNSLSLFNLTRYIMNCKELKLPYYRYVPIYNEIMCLKTLPLMYHIYTSYRPSLSYDYDWKKTDMRALVKIKYNLSLVKTIKNQFNKESMVSFSSIFTAIQALTFFYASSKKQLIIGIISAFSNKSHFNNFGSIPVVVQRPPDLADESKFKLNLENIIKQINDEVKLKRNILMALFSLTNIYNQRIESNKYCDIIMTGIPMSDSQLLLNNRPLESVSGSLGYTAMPVYILYLSDNKYIYTSQHIFSNDVDLTKLDYINQNINRLLE